MAEMQVKGGKGSPRVDLTPMVDLGFLLITFFMLATTMSKPKTMEIQMPFNDPALKQEDKSKLKASAALTILLSKDHRIYYYEGIGDDASNPPQVKVTGFKDQDGIRQVIIDKIKTVQGLVASGQLEADDKLTIVIKPDDNSKTDDLITMLDEMTINRVPIYTVVDITPVDKEFIDKTESANGI